MVMLNYCEVSRDLLIYCKKSYNIVIEEMESISNILIMGEWGIMKSTGIVRKVDELGRIVLPIEMRRTLDIAEKDTLEVYVEGESIILRKYQDACVFCDSVRDLVNYKGRCVCPECIAALSRKL